MSIDSVKLPVSSSDVPAVNTRGRKRVRSEETNPLHVLGYKVYRSALKVPKKTLGDVKTMAKDAARIFNYNETEKEDSKRLQAKINPKKCSKLTTKFLRTLDDFVTNNISSTLKPAEWNIIKSTAGCHAQAPHCDFIPDLSLARAAEQQMPLSVLVALMPGTRLNIWPRSIKLTSFSSSLLQDIKPIPCEILNLEPGDVLVFRGDFIHAGSSYSKDNYRLHTFLDSETVPRDPDTTWVVQKDGEPALKKIILSQD